MPSRREDEQFDAQIALSSLPRAFATRIDSVPAPVPYLAAEPELMRKWAARIGAEGFKIGVVWQGNANPEADMARSAPLAAFAPLAAIARRAAHLPAGRLRRRAARKPARRHAGRDLGPDFDAGPDSFLDTAAAMSQLDLIVTCDTSIAHLAGALARPTWVALKKDAEWRWLRDRDDLPWYPSLRLFRQRQRGEWSDVFAAMAGELARVAPAVAESRTIAIPGAIGELIDKITILEIKARKIEDGEKARNVRRELALLQANQRETGLDEARLAPLKAELVIVNQKLWDVEDDIRLCERAGDFGQHFVALARAVYVTNDRRAAIKREINRLFNSAIVEEKHYA